MQAAAISSVRASASVVAREEPRQFLGRLQVPLGIGFEAEARFWKRAFFPNAGEHVLQGAAVGRVVEHGTGGDQRRARALPELGEGLDAGAVVAAIGMPRGEIERGRGQRLLDAPELGFAVDVMPAQAGIQ